MNESANAPIEPACEGYRFAPVHVDARRLAVTVDGKPVEIEPKPLALLLALAEANGEVIGKQALLERLWPRQVVTDAVLNQCVLRARQALGDIGHRAIVTVHRHGYRLGLPVERIAAGKQSEASVTATTVQPTAHPARLWRGLAPALAALLIVAGGASWLARSPPPAAASIAVMPIEMRDGNAEDERIASGFGDALLTRLAQQADLHVPARTSVAVAAEHRGDIRRIGRELRVEHVVEAVLRPEQDGYVLHASIVRTSDGFQQWARRFDIPPGGLAAAEMTVVRAIADALSVEATGIATDSPVGIDSESAYKAFLDANALRNQRTEASLRWAIERYSEALRIDGDFAAAHAGLASAWLLLYEYSNLSLSEAQRAAQAHIDHALRLSPDLAEAHAAVGLLKLNAGDGRGAENALRRAVALERGNATTMMWLGTALTYQGRLGEARAWHEQALALDPLSAIAETYVGIDLALALDARAATHFDNARAIDPRLVEPLWQHALFERLRGNEAAAAVHLEKALAIDSSSEYTRALLAATKLAVGAVDDAARVLGAGSDGSLAIWLRAAIAVADARGDT
ncbi:winged helix-turn-helix domain-containing tetratricopeptide repeat protein, partial [Dokdonella sp.]